MSLWDKNTRILIVDDMPGMRRLLKSTLRGMGFTRLETSENGKQALQQMETALETGDAFGIILSDWNMPEMKGIEFLKAVRENVLMSQVPFFLITAEQEFMQVKEAILYGVTDYIVKPFTPAVLEEKLDKAWKSLNKGEVK